MLLSDPLQHQTDLTGCYFWYIWVYHIFTFGNKVHLSEHESSIVHSSAEWNHYYYHLLLYCFHQSCHFIKWVENSNNLRKQETFSSLGSDIPIWDRVLYKYTMHIVPLIKTHKLFRSKCIYFPEAYAPIKVLMWIILIINKRLSMLVK